MRTSGNGNNLIKVKTMRLKIWVVRVKVYVKLCYFLVNLVDRAAPAIFLVCGENSLTIVLCCRNGLGKLLFVNSY